MATPKQQRLIDDTVRNHVKYYDVVFSSYLKIRQEILLLNTTILKELKQQEEEDFPSVVFQETAFKLHQLLLDLQKSELLYKAHIEELVNVLQIQKVLKPDILTSVNSQLESIIKQNEELEKRIKDIKNVEQPILEKITTLVNSCNTNLAVPTARLLHPDVISGLGKDEDKKEKESTQIDYRLLVFDTRDLQKRFLDLTADKLKNTDIDEYLKINSKIFDRFKNDDSRVIYKLPRSSLHELDSTTTLDKYDGLISKTIEQIQTLQKEGESIKSSWNKNASKITKMDAILKEDENDVEMSQ
ncbi:hypothetical protein KGF56_003080 [Candida oxycetoniae]|uniref:Uncharacterized protein n=1 Tax=Candida oxycetoniae TaxID=497107 RepID=A0AAI9SWS7_9ASCO|nr:uncharacterized protein KGF56_003080 [Candida oxycetoniae]KAI3404180.2 hypothetical protein KGF56_003080 [Candida oxycetoniae]